MESAMIEEEPLLFDIILKHIEDCCYRGSPRVKSPREIAEEIINEYRRRLESNKTEQE
jgi:hypothetical protein